MHELDRKAALDVVRQPPLNAAERFRPLLTG